MSSSNNAKLLLMNQLKRKPSRQTLPAPLARPSRSIARRSHAPCGRLWWVCPWPRAELKRNPVEGFSAGLADEENMFLWEIMIMGPPETP